MKTVVKNRGKKSPASLILIDDVLSRIFELLSSEDRNNAKLVCKQWLEVLSQRCFTKKEAFFFPKFYNHHRIRKELNEFHRYDLINLKFERRYFFKTFEILWRKCGSRIESLHFNECFFYPDMLLHIFTYCVNLKHLKVVKSEISDPPQHRPIRFTFPQNQKYENLTFLDLYENDPLNPHDLLCIASAFPKLESLKVVLVCSSKGKSNTFPTFVQLLQKRFNHLISLHVKFEFKDDASFPKDFSSLNKSNFSRLKNISFSVCAPAVTRKENVEAIFGYKCWSAIKISKSLFQRTESNLEDTINSGIVRMLEENLFLEDLDADFSFTDILQFYFFFTALVKSSLKYLHLRLSYVSRYWIIDTFQEDHCLLKILHKNYTLLHLRLDIDTHVLQLNHLFSKYFPNVRHLEPPSTKDIDLAFQQQENLQSLRISHNFDSFQWILRMLPIKSLEYLEFDRLVVPSIDELLKLRVPNLRYLLFHYYPKLRSESQNMNSHKTFQALPKLFPKTFPNLRGIHIRWWTGLCPPNLEDLHVLFQSFQNFHLLRYISLSIQPACRKLEAHWKNITATYLVPCSSLKTLCITNGDLTRYYYYDRFANKFQCFKECNEFVSYWPLGIDRDPMNFFSYWLNKR